MKRTPEQVRETRKIAQQSGRLRLKEEAIDVYGGRCDCGETQTKYLICMYRGGYESYPRSYPGLVRLRREGWPGKAIEIICYYCRADRYPDERQSWKLRKSLARR